ncbi:MAG: sigma-70 family RNA polymerase sigma factor [Oscillospiraceae bacterium]|nr:sigma-70 family RNA polymerase sigma factor [Oscillospiraceae bacterium]
MTEAKVLRELQKGSQQALEWMIDTYNPYVSTIVYNIIGRQMTQLDVEETVSDVFLALWNNSHKIRPGMTRAYLGSIARNQAKKKLRKNGLTMELEENILTVETSSPQQELEHRERQQIVQQAVLAMEHPDREIFLRHYYYGQTISVICKQMHMTPSAVKSRLARGREKLKASLMQRLS